MPALKRYEKICKINGYDVEIHVCKKHFSKNLFGVSTDLEHCYGFGGVDIPEDPLGASVKDLERFFTEKNEQEIIFFINIDYYSIRALDLLWKKIAESNINLIIRLIGVMENDVGGHINELEFLPHLKNLKLNLGSKLKLGAETLGYAEFLSDHINYKVDYLPFPLIDDIPSIASKSSDVLRVGFLGAPREDKGYEIMPYIIQYMHLLDKNTQFVIQGELGYDHVWGTIPEGIKSQTVYKKSPLDHNLIIDLLKTCSVVFLPYDDIVYKNRGSAIMFEALEVGVPSVTFKNPAFARDIKEYGIGLVYDSFENLNLQDISNLLNNFEENRAQYICVTNENFKKSLDFK